MDAPESRDPAKTNPLHGVTLERMLNELVEGLGWQGMSDHVPIRCFESDPSVSSSLKFLRKTPWARAKVESLYLHSAAHPRKAPRTQPAE